MVARLALWGDAIPDSMTREEVGSQLPPAVVAMSCQKARFEDGTVYGNIPILDIQYGNIWTNIDRAT